MSDRPSMMPTGALIHPANNVVPCDTPLEFAPDGRVTHTPPGASFVQLKGSPRVWTSLLYKADKNGRLHEIPPMCANADCMRSVQRNRSQPLVYNKVCPTCIQLRK